jgi:hypothetical protein
VCNSFARIVVQLEGAAQPMTASQSSSGLLPAHGIHQLLANKQRIQREALGQIPEPLIQATTQVVARLAQKEAARQVLKPGVLYLVRQTLKELCRLRRQDSDTRVLLCPRRADRSEGQDGPAQ